MTHIGRTTRPAEEVIREMAEIAEAAGFVVDEITIYSFVYGSANRIVGEVRHEFGRKNGIAVRGSL